MQRPEAILLPRIDVRLHLDEHLDDGQRPRAARLVQRGGALLIAEADRRTPLDQDLR